MGNIRVNIYKSDDGKQDLVEMKIIGDPNTVIYKMSDKGEEIKKDFPAEYNAYYNTKAPTPKGTPIKKLKALNRGKIKFFEVEGITSIEQLADLSDGACHGLGKDVLDCRKQAKNYLAQEYDIKPEQVVGKE
tara:strand:- start:516 stop:911 length:396 start_codon:yes stop_codon:yes gene_type:complete